MRYAATFLKQVVAGVGKQGIFDRPESSFGARFRSACDIYRNLHDVSGEGRKEAVRLQDLCGEKCGGAVLRITGVRESRKRAESDETVRNEVHKGHGEVLLRVGAEDKRCF